MRCLPLATIVLALAVAACGSDSSPTASQPQQARASRRGFFLQDPKVRACLQKQGVRLPAFRRPPNGQRPSRDSAQLRKLRAALQKCGVTFPTPGGGPGGAPPGQGTSTSSAA